LTVLVDRLHSLLYDRKYGVDNKASHIFLWYIGVYYGILQDNNAMNYYSSLTLVKYASRLPKCLIANFHLQLVVASQSDYHPEDSIEK
jgi:hypothetical protein